MVSTSFKISTFLLIYGSSIAAEKNASALTPFIIGGTATTIEEHPYRALLEREDERCSGSIVSPNVILTAAHCVYDVSPSEYEIYVGHTSAAQKGDAYSALEVKAHPLYNGRDYDHDVGIIAIKGVFKFANKVQPIQLAPANYRLMVGSSVLVAGWGRTEVDDFPDILREVEVPVIPWTQCRDLYVHPADPDVKKAVSLDRKTFCAGQLSTGMKDACQGDSGGGVTQGGYLIGVVSWGIGCGQKYSPGVYSSVMGHRRWIVANIVYYNELYLENSQFDQSNWKQGKSIRRN